MDLMDHERLLLAKFYCEEALETIAAKPNLENGGWSTKLFSACRSMERGAEILKASEE